MTKYKLDRSSNKFVCPNCGKKRYVKFMNAEASEYLAEEFGRCDREQSCGYFNTPTNQTKWFLIEFITLTKLSDKAYKAVDQSAIIHFLPISQIKEIDKNKCWLPEWLLIEKQILYTSNESRIFDSVTSGLTNIKIQEVPKLEPSFHSIELLDELFAEDDLGDNFTTFLHSIFEADKVYKAKSNYFITGTNKSWKQTTIFWQIDQEERIHSGKMILYDAITGKRIKKPYSHISWLHSALKEEGFILDQCLFGLHLTTRNQHKTIAIVESEKTAIIMSILLPDFIWLATGGLGNLNLKSLEPIRNRSIILYPDKGTFNKWNEVAEEAKKIHFKIQTSNLLEETNLEDGADLADLYLAEFITDKI